MIDVPVGGIGEIPFASMGDLGLDKAKVIQCALSRICGVCAETLGRPVAFLGSAEEAEAQRVPLPTDARALRGDRARALGADWTAALGHPSAPREWRLVTTSGFEFVRMAQRGGRPPPGVLAQLPDR